jgi:hypothetical protein
MVSGIVGLFIGLMKFYPGGMSENSPAFQRRVLVHEQL